jgi:hypothetical protein
MQDLNDWFGALGTLEKIYWLIAIPSSLIFVIQIATAFLGGDGDDIADADMEVETDPGFGFHFITFRNLVAFFTIMSWTGIACLDSGFGNTTSIIIGILAGLFMMAAMAALMYFLFKLRASGTLKLKNAIGKTAETYLRIPAKKAGYGKIQLSIQGSVHEFNAVTSESEEIATGAIVEVIEVLNGNIMLVKSA